jgi:PAS domain S-box-containing protein
MNRPYSRAEPPFFERLLCTEGVLCCILGTDGVFERLSPSFEHLGYSLGELRARPLVDFVHPQDRATVVAELTKLAQGAPSCRFEIRVLCRDGSLRWLDWVADLEPSGHVYALVRDVTEPKRLTEELERQRHEYQSILDALPQMIWLKDADNRIIRANAAAARSIGLEPHEVEGRSTYDLYPEHAAKYHMDDLQVIRSAMPKLDMVEPYDVAPGEVHWVRTDKTPFRDAQGVVGVVVSAADVTAWKRGEDERARLYAELRESDERKTQFFANMSHELRTPLTLILAALEKLFEESDLPRAVREELGMLARNARTLRKHVDDLLDLSKLDARKVVLTYSAVDVETIVRQTVAQFESLARDRDVALDVHVAGPREAQLDREKLERVLTNVLANALKFTPRGGRVRCAARTEPPSELVPRGRLLLDVADSGPGIDPAFREAVFERFRQAEASSRRPFGGTGLGLTIAKELVALHGGRIAAGGAPEGGALITIELPLVAPLGAAVSSRTSEDGPRDSPPPTPRPAPRSGASPARRPPSRPRRRRAITGRSSSWSRTTPT